MSSALHYRVALLEQDSPDDNLQAELAAAREYYANPLGFVQWAFPWGKGTLANFTGPDDWQREFLEQLGQKVQARGFDGTQPVDAIRMATASGHGIGKSTLVAWIVVWIMSTRPHCQGTVTANTFTQLQTKTWAAIQKWTALSVTRSWFTTTGSLLYHSDHKETWFCAAQSCREENSEAFAGQHAVTSTSFYLFDEASAIPDKIFEVAEGGLTDGEPMIFGFGNPTRSTGKFYRITFGSERERWLHRSIDSRNCALPNKRQIAEWIEDYGEDSDFVRVRVRGLPPNADELQYIDRARVDEARQREVWALDDEPLIAGFDVSGGGSAWNVIRFRKGLNGRIRPPIRITGERGRDRDLLVGTCAELLQDKRRGHRIDMMFVDSAFGAPIVERLRVLGFKNVAEVNFGGQSPDPHMGNQRAHMYAKAKDWLLKGGIPANDEDLAQQLCLPGYHINRSGRLVLESKADLQKRGEASPDDADAFVLTFARPVAPLQPEYHPQPKSGPNVYDWARTR
jgi:hypothetical protein